MEGFCNYFRLVYTNMLSKVESKVIEIDTAEFYNYLETRDVSFFSGVPDSLLQDLNNCILERSKTHYVMPNEGLALSLASGYYTSTQKIPCVYLQNSGIGNIINPLMSLTHRNVYSIPMLIIIGWRGEPGVKDEPQHNSQGECMINLIKSMNFPLVYLDKLNWRANIDRCLQLTTQQRQPVFLVVRNGLF
jgi:phosphonopyruvate decarboxylase